MNLVIQKIIAPGDLENERDVFEVRDDDEVGFYGVFKTIEVGENTVSGRVRNTYWFPNKSIKKGDLVVLYSRVGVNTEKKQADGSTVHFFYWLNETPQWEKRQEKRDAVVVFKIGAWAHEIV